MSAAVETKSSIALPEVKRENDLPVVEAPKVNVEEVELEGKLPAGKRSAVSKTDAWQAVDWTNKDSIYKVFPTPQQEKIALARAKNISNTVDVRFDLKLPLSTKYLIQDARLLIEPNRKTVLVGEHASGKSVLFRAIAHGGIKEFPKHISVHHCEELEVTPEPISCLEAVVAAHEFRNVLVDCEFEVKKRMTADGVSESDKDKYEAVMEMLRFNLDKVKSDDAYERASKMLRVLGFDQVGQSRSTNSLSGGLRMRIALAAAFFVEADLLLLDEPTNHLDFPSVLWLENRLRSYRQSFLIICHDRDMLENVCTSLIWLTEKTLKYFPIGFKAFEAKREKEDAVKDAMIDKFLQANRNVDPSSPKAKQKDEYKTWQENYQARKVMLQGKFTFPDPTPLEKQAGDPEDPKEISILNLHPTTFSYDNGVKLPFIFKEPISFNVKFSTRCGVMGPNGAGKSTFLKLLTKRLIPTTGSLTQHPTATIAYFAQHHVAELNLDQTPIDFMISQFPEVENSGILRKHLAKVGIAGPMAETRMTGLSSGQRSCVIFAKITYICPHLLIMDEPTNFLDLDSVDSLIAATNKYPGALLLVSHNRGFLKKCANQYLSVVPGRFEVYDDLKSCERATYSFIAELEEGNTSGAKLGASALQSTSTALSSNQPGGPKPKAAANSISIGGVKSISISSVKAAPKKPAAAPAPAAPAKGAPAKGAAKAPAKAAPKAGKR